jgi:hypothetical protein
MGMIRDSACIDCNRYIAMYDEDPIGKKIIEVKKQNRGVNMKGSWSGYRIRVESGGKIFELKTKSGVRGLDVPVHVIELNGVWSAVTENGNSLEIIKVSHVLYEEKTNRRNP